MQRYKYPRTFHLPWSLGAASDDKILSDTSCFINKDIIVTEKMDGESTSMYPDYIHARSIDGKYHPSRTWVKHLQSSIGYCIPEGWRICGENMYAQHSIPYDQLLSYFLVYSIWNEDWCLPWEYTVEFCDKLKLQTVPVIYQGPYNEKYLKELAQTMDFTKQEGYVIRIAGGFYFDDFSSCVAKFVRQNHVQSDKHWMQQQVIPNKLLRDDNAA